MSIPVEDFILEVTGAASVFQLEVIQRLWRGYGNIVRYGLIGCDLGSVIVKHVRLLKQHCQSPGLKNDVSHQRKVRSYQVETVWYQDWSRYCDDDCRVPQCLASTSYDDEVLIVLEDLDAAGFPRRQAVVDDRQIHACLHWLANFHATFIGEQPTGLWPTGTYWHLETRPDEWQALDDIPLKNAAAAIDQKLRDSPYQTLVHGDAKLANFCFSKQGNRVAAVDFQYVGGGCGIKDVAYFIDSCLDGEQCQRQESQLLAVYFQALRSALKGKCKTVDVDALEQNWRALYPRRLDRFSPILERLEPWLLAKRLLQ